MVDHGQYAHLSYRQLHEQGEERGHNWVYETRLTAMGAEDNKRISGENHEKDTSASALGQRGRSRVDVMEPLNGSQLRRVKRYRAGACRAASVAEMEVAKEHSQ